MSMIADRHLDKAVIAIAGGKNGVFEIRVAGYEFPEAEDLYDRNWLNVSFRAKDDTRDDSCLDACLLTWELGDLADGLEEFLASPEEKEYLPNLMENILWLEFRKNGEGTVDMLLEFTSEGKMSPTGEWECFRIERRVSERDILRAVKVMRLSLAAFPFREVA